ncbi:MULTISPECIES: BTAD domain-containing putative transcriptional regulator [unclassified Streptomyces]|uniref:ATP-binding protein n=1 Tax=unclassified Streptomyces TaxID=2593676 RepID=UPI00037E2039|nr:MULTISPECIES: BTAD domain-containing putative transcriptional regulator [unclassified Streptomyces]MYT28550.1 AAA family ATPase [Streptomyces sp. SID8354]
MRFGILGGTQAWCDDGAEVPLGGPARRALLALLLVRPGEVVPAERLADGVGAAGGDAAPVPSAHALQSQVSRLRSALGGAAVIERSGAGYRLVVAPDEVDAGRFEELTRDGRAALRDGDPRRAAQLLREGLGLWRGPALVDVADSEPGQAAAARLEEIRLTALEDRYEAELCIGEHRAAATELRALLDRHPLRERLAGLLMRALFADGGQAAALLVFEEVRRRLADELGTDPSAELTGLHRELLHADASPSPTPPPAELTALVGRAGEVTEVGELLRAARLVTLTGPGGVGKTRLAVAVAASATDDVCFAELGALPDAAHLPQALLAALGLRERGLHMAHDDQGPLDRLRTALSGRTLLLVLDNCEHLVEDVAPLAARLLAACPQLRVLATSREPLGIIGEHLHPVRPLDDQAAQELFTDRARAVRRAFVPDPAAVQRVCTALDNLPLAIELVAARLRTLSLDELAAGLSDRPAFAARGSRTTDGRHRTLRSTVAWSWDLLSEPEQRVARRFSVFAAGASVQAATKVCDTDEETLESLADKSLLDRSGGRYRMLATIRAYGAERLDAAGEMETIRRTHARTLLARIRAADPWLRRGEQLARLAELTAEQPDILAAVQWAVVAPEPATALELLAAASSYLWIRGQSGTLAPQAAALLHTVGEEPPTGLEEEYAVCVLLAASGPPEARTAWHRHRDAADRALTEAWSAGRAGSWPAALLPWMIHNAGAGDAAGAYALVSAQRDRPEPWTRAAAQYVAAFGPFGDGDLAEAERGFQAAAEQFRALGERWGTALTLDALASLAAVRGDRDAALALTDEALTLAEQLGAWEDYADLLVNRGDHRLADDPAAARADYTRAADRARRAGSATALAAAQRGLADLALLDGDPTAARHLYLQALEHQDSHWVKGLANRIRTLTGLARIAEERGELAEARARYRQAARSATASGAVPSTPLPDALRLMGLPEPLVQAVRRGAADR